MFGWDRELLNEIQSLTSTQITMSEFMAPHPEEQYPELLSVDGASILLVTDKSLKNLEAMWGKPIDQRRFRGNFLVEVSEDSLGRKSGSAAVCRLAVQCCKWIAIVSAA